MGILEFLWNEHVCEYRYRCQGQSDTNGGNDPLDRFGLIRNVVVALVWRKINRCGITTVKVGRDCRQGDDTKGHDGEPLRETSVLGGGGGVVGRCGFWCRRHDDDDEERWMLLWVLLVSECQIFIFYENT